MKLLDKVNSPKDIKQMNISSLNVLCKEIREFLVNSVSKTGGHLSSNLGICELTVALHYSLNSPEDKIIWDVGHQAYVHKILTGRKNNFGMLRQLNGLSGFPSPKESPHDSIKVGHSSTSISQAFGIAVGRDLSGDNYNVVAVVGDGSITGGLTYEAMNNAGQSNTNMIVVLNDNQMSISGNVGSISRHLNDIRINPRYVATKSNISKIVRSVPLVGKPLNKALEKTKNSLKYLLVPGVIFEELGFKYIGPINGHNLAELISVINQAKKMNGPVLLHVYTKKGKGYIHSEISPSKFHGIEPFDVKSGNISKQKLEDSYTDVFSNTLLKIAEKNDKLVAITAAMPDSTGLEAFSKKYPKKTFDVGIAEGHAVTFAAGLSKSGYIPVFAVYSSFLQRSYDQIIHDVCLENRHVIFAIDRAGIVGSDGETHQGLFDLSFLSHIPNMVVLAPKNKIEFEKMFEFCSHHGGPISIRYPRGMASTVLNEHVEDISLGKSETIFKGEKIALVSFGAMMDNAYKVYEMLKNSGYSPTLINARFLAPIDLEMVKSLSKHEYVFSFEDNLEVGGFGSALLSASNIKNFYNFAFPKEFIPHGTREQLFDIYGLSTEKMYKKIIEIIEV
ncbi:MAG: 1-deoxy-D-xylulose-5-phosphate synthase [Defluviitaleaceae bacterium]|nr:1-deoxy-D-xylulose-5-phosphate synthase [Defluviitaleaceae bacterium]